MRALNLASRPFRNERLPNVLASLALGAALLASAYHVHLAREVMPDRTSALTQKLAEREAESARLRTAAGDLRVDRPDPGTVAQWTQLKDLVDRRVFSWSGLFSVLEDTMPDGVKLLSVSPEVREGEVTLKIVAVARTFDEALGFMRALEDRPEFSDVWPTRREGTDAPEYQYDMKYVPQTLQAVAPAPTASTEPGPSAPVQVSARTAP